METTLDLNHAARSRFLARCRQAISLLDLTSLNAGDGVESTHKLCARALTPHGAVAAVCVWTRFVGIAKDALAGTGVKVAAVANFPVGGLDAAGAARESAAIVAAGGNEVDVVFPYNAWLNSNRRPGFDLVKACKDACGNDAALKVILETGCLRDQAVIADAADCAIEAGADFIKTSTGKSAVSATTDTARSAPSSRAAAPAASRPRAASAAQRPPRAISTSPPA
jgi:deoxyribose-phosphate aldolase